MKKLLVFLLCTIMILGTLAVCASAAPAREVENNNLAAKATAFTGSITGALQDGERCICYSHRCRN